MRCIVSIVTLIAKLISATACITIYQVRAQSADPGLTFLPMEEKTGGSVQVVGGEAVQGGDWRTVIIANMGWALDRDGRPLLDTKGARIPSNCTATMIGPGVALTAAHCFDRGGNTLVFTAKLQIRDKDKTIEEVNMTCSIPAGYIKDDYKPPSPRNAEDFALCRFPVLASAPLFKGIRYEVVDMGNPPADNQNVLLTGYGCKGVYMGADGLQGINFDEVFTIADAVIDDPDYLGRVEIKSDGETRPMICFGDSGGPMMTGMTTKSQGPLVARRVLAVNSSIDTRDGYYVSQMMSLTQATFATFLVNWLTTNSDAMVCGMPGKPLKSPCRT